MAVAQGQCPNCGGAMTFSVGQSASQVCRFCRHVVVRTDRDWKNLGKAADLANTPARMGVGDRGVIRGVNFEVLGRVQMDYGQGPWDEFYVLYGGDKWGWIAEAQGNLYVTQKIDQPFALPQPQSMRVDQSVSLSTFGTFKIAETRRAKVLSAEGELPNTPTAERLYADCHGANSAFATLDYNDGTRLPEVFIGSVMPLGEAQIQPRGGERTNAQKVALEALQCPSCGAKLPAPKPGVERVACAYCKAISEPANGRIIAQQADQFAKLFVPIGAKGNLAGTQYTCIGYMRRSARVEGELFGWEEYLLWNETVGFRWLMLDEGNWLFVRPISVAEVQAGGNTARWHNRSFSQRNDNEARVNYVLGEFYWKVEVGETVRATDFVSGSDVLSREASPSEISWSYCTPVAASQVAQALGIAAPAPMPYVGSASNTGGASAGGVMGVGATILVIAAVVCCVVCLAANGSGTSSGSSGSYSSSSGSSYSGGGGSFGGFGGK